MAVARHGSLIGAGPERVGAWLALALERQPLILELSCPDWAKAAPPAAADCGSPCAVEAECAGSDGGAGCSPPTANGQVCPLGAVPAVETAGLGVVTVVFGGCVALGALTTGALTTGALDAADGAVCGVVAWGSVWRQPSGNQTNPKLLMPISDRVSKPRG